MKKKIWPYQIPIIIALSLLMIVFKLGENGLIQSSFIRDGVYPLTQIISRNFTDMKFKIRPQRQLDKKIIIVGIDSHSLEAIGRWPWARNYMAYLTETIMQYDPKVLGLDIVFSERDQRVPDELVEFLIRNKLGDIVNDFETDYVFQQTLQKYKEKIVLGMVTETNCRPAFDRACAKYVVDPEYIEMHPENYERFAIEKDLITGEFNQSKTPLMSIITPIVNIDLFRDVIEHTALLNITPDSDGIVRRADLNFFMDGRAYPILPLKMALVGQNEKLLIQLDDKSLYSKLEFLNQKKVIEVNKLGAMEINFLGDKFSIPYISAIDLMGEGNEIKLMDGSSKVYSKKELLKDAYVLIGLTAVAAFDTRSFPTGENIPGVEGHATILENLLNHNNLKKAPLVQEIFFNLAIMVLGGVIFNVLCLKVSALKSFLSYILIMGIIGYIDLYILFKNNFNWENAFVFIEFNIIYFSTVLIKYFLEERDKKFFREAFSNYISPELVGQMYESGNMPQLGGATRHLTAYFTDIQNFSTFSEKLSPDRLVELLNEYLTVMTDTLVNEGGTLDKYEGDAIIAFFGAPLEFSDHAKRACVVALKMQYELSKLRSKWKSEGEKHPSYVQDMRMRIGINTGMILSGNMGSRNRMNYTMMGDDVNLAARLESSAKQYGVFVHVADHTYEIVKEDFLFRELDTIRVVGRSSATKTYELLDMKVPTDPRKIDLVESFQRGLEFYKVREWDKAIDEFTKASELEFVRYPDIIVKNNPSLVYIERCEFFKVNPPPSDWDGVYTLNEK
ncbi:CHASE2 domain protein [Bacteriovorax sp. BSW11_IV]|uniref:adenylate/guanylate cyclase domain-containing protein n=1 Tax=Bacteriovorax sp. BSW11_IV TaxID=1353529 RepID=UPI00038A1483|nr:adenylate/guanylate cyclase domain-containing protein [Bacteriovorax sp. BSW11_IV]EQC44945.1 CHASE2 domain protein [Bacteriovorax sp. BSW11_IV]